MEDPVTSTEDATTQKSHMWEGTLVAILGGVIAVLTLVSHLTAHRDPDRIPARPAPALGTGARQSSTGSVASVRRAAPVPPHPVNRLEVAIGPSAIAGQFKLLSVNRRPATPTSDTLTLRIRVTSRAMADLVTPFQSAMLEVRIPALKSLNPEHPFAYPVPAGNSREEDIAFAIPSRVSLEGAALRIHYYNELKEIPLGLLLPDSTP